MTPVVDFFTDFDPGYPARFHQLHAIIGNTSHLPACTRWRVCTWHESVALPTQEQFSQTRRAMSEKNVLLRLKQLTDTPANDTVSTTMTPPTARGSPSTIDPEHFEPGDHDIHTSHPIPNEDNSSTVNNRNWKYLLDSSDQWDGLQNINWQVCFDEGRRNGFFETYSTPTSLKSAFYRWRRRYIG
ncbi:hypothetical protein DM01DRAFT_359388 [Hesseltinella vesiculosa]|uniref:Uncharacterized protein n=1 Tax=Hesseltinella vesiculosa TaxID=101127 RepID=A0A1X2G6Q9_9FUNG|nr:hypothetical protein DM01DRAFT_359388 [Hesseltinella vesiculosa]